MYVSARMQRIEERIENKYISANRLYFNFIRIIQTLT